MLSRMIYVVTKWSILQQNPPTSHIKKIFKAFYVAKVYRYQTTETYLTWFFFSKPHPNLHSLSLPQTHPCVHTHKQTLHSSLHSQKKDRKKEEGKKKKRRAHLPIQSMKQKINLVFQPRILTHFQPDMYKIIHPLLLIQSNSNISTLSYQNNYKPWHFMSQHYK